ncbi:MAG: 3-dehydroquinate synthase [Lachnospiraceae bacterium]|nr:3-dehydroquinate synthase [Lachnospiraceae bacterium]
MRRITVRTGKETYDVLVGSGLLKTALGSEARRVSKGVKAMIVSDDNVFPLYGETVRRALEEAGFEAHSFVFSHGETSKTLDTYAALLDELCTARLTRSDLVLSLGGGVSGDLAGFAAATYRRGTGFFQIPTSLLSCVDACIGGKTGVDLPGGKNQAGAFYQPLGVVIDTDVLKTLPEEEYRNGCAEVVKTAVIEGEDLFRLIEKDEVRQRYEDVISSCIEVKKKYVERDERDEGIRRILNLGHTFAHAAEQCSGYAVQHGTAVSMGLAAVSRAAFRKGLLPEEDCERIVKTLKRYGLPTGLPYSAEALYGAAGADKKNTGSGMNLIVPRSIGKCEVISIERSGFHEWLRLGGAS